MVQTKLSSLVPRDEMQPSTYLSRLATTRQGNCICWDDVTTVLSAKDMLSSGCMIEAWITAVTSECVMDRSPEPHPHLLHVKTKEGGSRAGTRPLRCLEQKSKRKHGKRMRLQPQA